MARVGKAKLCMRVLKTKGQNDMNIWFNAEWICVLIMFLMVCSSLGVVFSRQPVYSVFWLMTTFIHAAALGIMIGATFLAFMVLIVYIGAVAVFFLFMMMMLGGSTSSLLWKIKGKTSCVTYSAMFLTTAVVIMIIILYFQSLNTCNSQNTMHLSELTFITVQKIGELIYTSYILEIQIMGIILLIAMIGAVVLALPHSMQKMRHARVIKTKPLHFEHIPILKQNNVSSISSSVLSTEHQK